ncbi:MAG: ATP-binding protein [bacterium]|nr:ATP-binding protein [bacterium]
MTVQQESVNVVELRIPCKPEFVSVARLAVAGISNRLHFTVEEIEDIKLAVAEACTNCIQRSPDAKEITIMCEIATEELRIIVRDHSIHSPAELDSPELGSGGLGVFLIRSLMDEVDYRSDDRDGTVLRMVKRAGGT